MATAMVTRVGSTSIAKDLIKSFEGLRLEPYHCSAGRKTIGYGHVIQDKQTLDTSISPEMAEQLLDSDIHKARNSLQRNCHMPLTQTQEAALISFIFNCGSGAFQASSLRQKLLRGEYLAASLEFPRWVYARGVKLRGLVRRRLAEQELFLAEL
jgi:lysozyme